MTRLNFGNEDDTVIVCSPADGGGNFVPGGVWVPCVECDMPAYVSPSSFDVLAEGAHVLCFHCFRRRLEEDPDDVLSNLRVHPNHKAQSAEMIEWLRSKREPQ